MKGEDKTLNVCRFSGDNTLIATGGDDCMVRVFQVDPKSGFKHDPAEMKAALTLEGHYEGVNCVDISQDKKLLVSSSKDCTCFIFNIDLTSREKGQRLHKLTFADLVTDPKNMWMRGCFFADSGNSVYSLAT